MNINKDNLSYYSCIIAFSLGLIMFIVCIICLCNKSNKKQTTSPVEEIVIIDSLNKANTKLIIEVEFLDSIKDVEKDKVLNLNNDSTLKLFYELLRKE